MTVTGPSSIPVGALKPLDLSQLKPVKMADSQMAEFRKGLQSLLEIKYTSPVNLKNHPAYSLYAEVKVGGKTVAKLDNNGYLTTSNALGAKLQKLPNVQSGQGKGPILAQARAEEIAKLLGGEIVKAHTALSQAQYYALPELRFKTDYEAMQQDPLYQMLSGDHARTLLEVQRLGAEEIA